MTIRPFTVAAALLAISIAPVANVASAMPISKSVAVDNSAAANVQTVQYHGRGGHGRYYGGRGDGAGVAAGIIGGMILGGMLAAPRDYDYAPGPYYGPGYYGGDDADGYCMQRFRSYDPRSGTYLGYDGYRHPCP
jgi:hypothetical protein